MSPWVFTLLLAVALSMRVTDQSGQWCPDHAIRKNQAPLFCPICGTGSVIQGKSCLTEKCGVGVDVTSTCQEFGLESGGMTKLKCMVGSGFYGLCVPSQEAQQEIKPKQEIIMNPDIKTGKRSYWVINGHASYFGEQNVRSQDSTYFFTELGCTLSPDHETFTEIRQLTWKNTQGYDGKYQLKKRKNYPIPARKKMHDYFIEYCDYCKQYSGIFHVTIEYTDYGDGSEQSKVQGITKYDLSKMGQNKGVLLSDVLQTLVAQNPAPLYSLGCRTKMEDPKPEMIVSVSTLPTKALTMQNGLMTIIYMKMNLMMRMMDNLNGMVLDMMVNCYIMNMYTVDINMIDTMDIVNIIMIMNKQNYVIINMQNFLYMFCEFLCMPHVVWSMLRSHDLITILITSAFRWNTIHKYVSHYYIHRFKSLD